MEARLPVLAQCEREDQVEQQSERHTEAGPADNCITRSVREILQYGSAGTYARNVRAETSQREQQRVLKRSADLIDQLDCRQVQTESNSNGSAQQCRQYRYWLGAGRPLRVWGCRHGLNWCP